MDTTQNLAGNNNATNKSAQAFKHIYFIMIAPSHPGNIGAAARALKTMGFHQLILVDVPPSVTSHPDALAMASGAAGVLKEAKVVSTLGQALSNIHLTYALSARPRYIGPPACHIREAAKQSANNIWQQNINIGLVLGTERIGLTNEQALHCNYLCHIPTNDRYSSLNVAQALQIAAWEFRYALLDGDNKGKSLLPTAIKGKKHKREKPASSQEVDNFLMHWLEALFALNIIQPDEQKKIPQRMAHFFRRYQMREDEVSLFRGVCSAILKKCRTQKKE